MLSQADNDLLCRVGPGTPMGDLMREYWLPALRSDELPRNDSDPVRIMLLGEPLIAFRTTSGAVGLIQNACPHRGASLFYGRNEEEGLRCVYHGWKFDAAGSCVDMPSEPPDSQFKDKVRATAYPCVERGGVVWTYMGSRENPPPLPDFESNQAPEGAEVGNGPARGSRSEWNVFNHSRNCNWMQALEGDIDTSHATILHMGKLTPDDVPEDSWTRLNVSEWAPKYSVVDTDYGTCYGAYRPAGPDHNYWRIASFLFPFYTMVPVNTLGGQAMARAWVPMDDEHTMFWSMSRRLPYEDVDTTWQDAANASGHLAARGLEFEPNTTDWYGRFNFTAKAENDYLMDREEQRNSTYSGLPAIVLEDQMVTETMGPIYDRPSEHLGTSDAMIIRTRMRLINAARALRERGEIPPGVEEPEVYRQRSGGVVLPKDVDWLEATAELRKAYVMHEGLKVHFTV